MPSGTPLFLSGDQSRLLSRVEFDASGNYQESFLQQDHRPMAEYSADSRFLP